MHAVLEFRLKVKLTFHLYQQDWKIGQGLLNPQIHRALCYQFHFMNVCEARGALFQHDTFC